MMKWSFINGYQKKNRLMQVSPRLQVLLLLSVLTASTLHSEELAQPSVDLLEFLGSYQDDNGKWIDPAEMENIKLPKEQTDEQPTEQ